MVKNIFGSLGKGFFYTIGRIIALIFVGLVIATLLTKIKLPDLQKVPYTQLLMGVRL